MKLLWLLSVAATSVVYLQALHGGFLFDDFPNIVENAPIHLASLSFSGLMASLDGASAGPLGRPISVFSFALTHWYFGLDPYAFKAINLAIHLINGLLVGWFVLLLVKQESIVQVSDGAQKWLPIWVATAWSLHPIHFVAINMAVQRMTLLAAMFTLLALIAHLKAVSPDRSRLGALSWGGFAWAVCWPLAALSKETGLLFPLFAWLLFFFPRGGNSATSRRDNRILYFIGAAMLLMAVGMIWRIGFSWLEAGYSVRDFTLYERLLTQARVLWFYLGQILLPNHEAFALYLDWFPVSRGWFDPRSTLVAVCAWGLVIGALIRYRHSQSALAFGLAWFLLGHSLESTFIPLEMAHEHRNYLPALGLLFALGVIGAQFFERVNFGKSALIPVSASLAMLLIFGGLTGLRSAQNSDALIGAQTEATRHEMSARANYVAALSLIQAGYGDRDDPMGAKNVRFYLEQSERADGGFKLGYLALISWACASGRQVDGLWLTAFSDRLENTAFTYGQLSVPTTLLKMLSLMPQCLSREEALVLFESGGRNQRAGSRVRSSFIEGAADYELLVQRDPIAARQFYVQAIGLDAGNIALRNKIKGLIPAK